MFGFSGDGGPAIQAQLANPAGISWDPAGNLYVADTQNSRIRRVAAATGTITTFAGTGTPGSDGDGGPATLAKLATPIDVAIAPDGDVVVLEFGGHRVRRIDIDTGIITTIGGTGTAGFSGDGGPATTAQLNRPRGLAVLSDGAIVVADTDNQRLRRIDPHTGVITTIAGTGSCGTSSDGIPATSAPVCSPYGVTSDADGNLYVGDSTIDGVRRIDALTGIITTVVRSTIDLDGSPTPRGDGLPALENVDNFPADLSIDASGNLFLAVGGLVRRVDAVTSLMGTVAGGGDEPASTTDGPAIGIAFDFDRIASVAVHPSGVVAFTTGNSVRVVSPDGPPSAPSNVALEPTGDGAVDVSWTGPSEPVSAARVVLSPSGTIRHVERAEIPGPVEFTGLTGGSVTATVAAFNGWGWSSPSTPSSPVDLGGDPPPTLFDQFDADATGTAPVNAFLLNLLANAVYKETWDPDHSARTDESWRELMTQRAAEWGLSDISFDITNNSTGTQSIAVRTDDALIVSFRGTEPNEGADLYTDAGVALVSVITPYGPVNVHVGFWSALDSVYPELLAMAQEVPGQPVWLTGHSLGGSLAALAAFRLALDGVTVGGVHTVGAPAVGDLALTLVYDIGLDLRERTQRWVNDHDIVPMAFDLLPGYVDLGTTNVFTRRSLDDPRDFDVVLDALVQPYAAPGLDDHDDALYATRIWELIRRTDPAAAAALPEPEPPYLRPTGVDTQRAVRFLVTYFAGELELLIAGLVEEAQLTALEAATLMREAEAPYTLIARVLSDGYQLTVDEIGPVLADLGATLQEIEEALAALGDEVVSLLNDGLAAVGANLGEWAAALGFDGDASLVPTDLAALFDVESLLALIDLPTIDPAATLEEAIAALEAQGLTVDASPPDGSLLQAELVVTVDDLESLGAAIAPGADVLDGLAEALSLTGTGGWTGSLTVTLVFGVDAGGFYLSPESSVELGVDGTVAVSTVGSVAGAPAEITGTATADLVATARPAGTERIRPGPTAPSLNAALSGTVATTLDADLGDTELTWDGTWDVSSTDGTASSSLRTGAALGGTTTLTFLDGGGAPPVVDLNGVLEPAGWRISGALSGQFSAGALTVTGASVDALLTPTSFSGTGTLDAEVSLAGSETIPGQLTIDWRPTGTTVSGTMDLDDVTAGALARFDGITLGFAATGTGIEISLSSKDDGRIELFHDQQLLTVVEPSGMLSTDGTLTFSAATATGLVAGVIEIEATDPEITLRAPGTTPSALLTLPSVVGAVPTLGGASIEFTGLQLMDDGTFRASSVVADPADIEAALGIAGILPINIDSVAIVFPDNDNLDRFDAEVTGTFDATALAGLPFTPILTIGRSNGTSEIVDTAQPFEFTVRADSFSTGQIRPVDLGPITIGFADLRAGPLTLGSTITLGGYQDGEFQSTVGGALSVLAEADGLSASADATLVGDLALTPTGGVLDLAAALTIGGSYQDVFELTGLALSARLRIVLDDGVLTMDELQLDDLTVDEISMQFGDLVRITASDVTIDLTPTFGSNLIVFGGDPTNPGASVEFLGAALAGWEGSAGNVALRYVEGDNGFPVIVPVLLPGFYADVTVGDSGIGLPDWLPFEVRAAGLTLPDVLTGPIPDEGIQLTTEVLDGMRVRVSGGMVANGSWPVTAEVEGLEVDLGLLAKTPSQFPITNLDAVMFGVEPFSIGPTTVGGGMGLGMVEVDVDPGPAEVIEPVFFFRVFGEFSYSGFGAGLDLVLTEYGPVLASVTAPAPIPLGTSGLMLAGVRGGMQFGGDGLVPPSDPIELLDAKSPYQLEFPVNIDTIKQAVRTCAEENYGQRGIPDATWPCFTWNDGGLLYLGATLTSYAAPGAVAANITGAIDLRFGPKGELPKLRLAAAGTADVYGFKIARAGMLLALDDPLAPSFDMAMRMPDLSGPLGFMMGATGEFTIDLDTTGIAAGAIEASRILLAEIEDGAVTGGRQLLADALDELAASAELSRTLVHDDPDELARVAPYRRLAFELLDLNGDGELSASESAQTIDRTFLVDRMLGRNGVPGLLPASYPTDARALDLLRTGRVPQVLAAFQTALLGEAQRLAEVSGANYDLAAFLADPTVTTYGAAGLAFVEVMTESVANGIASGAAAWGAVFDPTFVMEGGIQPMVLGVPFGEPTDKGTFYINRKEIGFGLSASAESLVLSVFGGAGVAAAELNKVFGSNTIVETFGTLPVPDVFGAMAEGDPIRLDPFASDWRVEMGVTAKVAGFTLATGRGLLIPPKNESVMRDGLCRLDDPRISPCIGDRIPVNGQDHWDAIYEHGGLVISSELRAPRFVTDPAGVLADLVLQPPDDPLGWFDLIEDNLAAITSETSVGRWQAFIPSFLELLDPRYVADRSWPTAADEVSRFGVESFEAVEDDVVAIWGEAYGEGVWDAVLLGVPIANGTMSVDDTGYRVDANFPPFGNLPLTFTFGGITVTTGGSPVTLPVPGVDVTVSAAEVIDMLDAFGLPDTVIASTRATGRLQAYGAGYDPESTNPLQRTGGLRVDATLSLAGLVSDARFALEVRGADPATADLYGTASVPRIGPIAGVTINDATVTLQRVNGAFTVSIDGEAATPIGTATASGTLNGQLEGSIELALSTGGVDLGGFQLDTGLRLDLSRDSRGNLVGGLAAGGTFSFPPLGIVNAAATVALGPTGIETVDIAVTSASIGAVALTNATFQLRQEPLGSTTYRLVVAGTATVPGVRDPLTVSGWLGPDGTGSLTATGGTIRLGTPSVTALTLTDASATLVRTATAVRLELAGTATVFGAALPVTGRVTIASTGISGVLEGSAATVPFGAASIGGTFTLAVAQTSATALPTVSSSFDGTATIPGIGSALAAAGSISTTGTSTLILDATSRTIDGFNLTNGTFRLIRTASATSFSIDADLAMLGQTVEVVGSLSISTGGFCTSAACDVSLTAPQPWNLNGYSLQAGFVLRFLAGDVSVSVSSMLTVPGIDGSFALSGILDTTSSSGGNLVGELTATGSADLRLGGSASALRLQVSGAMKLNRTMDGANVVTSFTLQNASLSWDGVSSFSFAASVTIRSNGSLDATASGRSFDVGVFEVTVPSVALSVSALGASAQATFGSGSLRIDGITPSTVTLPGFTVDATGGVAARALSGLASLGLNSYSANGPFVFERVDGAFRVRLSSPSTLGVPGLPSPIVLDSFVLASDGVVTAGISATRIGPDALSIRRATIAFTRTPAAGARLTVSNGRLYLPVGDPIALPTLTFAANGTLTQSLNRALVLGSGMRVPASSTGTVELALTAENGVLKLRQTADRTFTLLGATSTLQDFEATSAGAFTGEVTGSFRALGYEMSSGTFTVSKPPGWVDARLTISSTDPFTASFGPFQGTVTGWVATNGRHQLTVAGSITLPFPGAWLVGSVSLGLRNYGIINATFSGKACVTINPEAGCVSLASLSIDSSGNVTPNVFGFTGTVNVLTWNNAGADTRPPTFRPLEDISVNVASAPTVVNYPLPAASDDRDDSVAVTCVKGSGSSFSSGPTTVNCTATDDAGNKAERSFGVTVNVTPSTSSGGAFELGDAATVESGGFMSLSAATVTMFSSPIALGTAQADGDGNVALTFTVPTVEPGRHHVQIDGVAPDGSALIAVIPIDVLAPPTPVFPDSPIAPLPPVSPFAPVAPVAPSTPISPVSQLPQTGSEPAPVILFALLLLVLGATLMAVDRPRRRAGPDPRRR
ncbi:MAG TPA: HYR domain-containing protein [Ilumatobacteraceae bacterium]|nr:HYR domain-containing protein [Ilumatobacteraceae bacterium]